MGGLLGILTPEETEAAGRRKRRKKAHKHGKGRRRKHKHKCRAESVAQTCAGKCGSVQNYCKKPVDCEPCNCGVCPICQVSNVATGQCIPDPATAGDACGNGLHCVDANASVTQRVAPTAAATAMVRVTLMMPMPAGRVVEPVTPAVIQPRFAPLATVASQWEARHRVARRVARG